MRKLLATIVAALAFAPLPALADPVAIEVTTAPSIQGPQSGRVLVFAHRVEPGAPASNEIDSSPFEPTGTAVAGREVQALTAGRPAMVDGETDAFPTPFSQLPPGTYRFQAVLDRNHDYNYGGRGAGDIVSPVVEVRLPGPVPRLVLTNVVPEPDIAASLARQPAAAQAAWNRAIALDFVSPRLSAFWGYPVHIRGWVMLPPGYQTGGARFPVVYTTGGFGSNLLSSRNVAAMAGIEMDAGHYPPMIWVSLDHSSATGTHEFADSANNGPGARL